MLVNISHFESLLYTKSSFYAPKSGDGFDTFSGSIFSIYIHGFEINCQLCDHYHLFKNPANDNENILSDNDQRSVDHYHLFI